MVDGEPKGIEQQGTKEPFTLRARSKEAVIRPDQPAVFSTIQDVTLLLAKGDKQIRFFDNLQPAPSDPTFTQTMIMDWKALIGRLPQHPDQPPVIIRDPSDRDAYPRSLVLDELSSDIRSNVESMMAGQPMRSIPDETWEIDTESLEFRYTGVLDRGKSSVVFFVPGTKNYIAYQTTHNGRPLPPHEWLRVDRATAKRMKPYLEPETLAKIRAVQEENPDFRSLQLLDNGTEIKIMSDRVIFQQPNGTLHDERLSNVAQKLCEDPQNPGTVYYHSPDKPNVIRTYDTNRLGYNEAEGQIQLPSQYSNLNNLFFDASGNFLTFNSEEGFIVLSRDLRERLRIPNIRNSKLDEKGTLRGLERDGHMVEYRIDFAQLNEAQADPPPPPKKDNIHTTEQRAPKTLAEISYPELGVGGVEPGEPREEGQPTSFVVSSVDGTQKRNIVGVLNGEHATEASNMQTTVEEMDTYLNEQHKLYIDGLPSNTIHRDLGKKVHLLSERMTTPRDKRDGVIIATSETYPHPLAVETYGNSIQAVLDSGNNAILLSTSETLGPIDFYDFDLREDDNTVHYRTSGRGETPLTLKQRYLTPEDKRVIIASSKLFQTIPHQEALNLITTIDDPLEASKLLEQKARELGVTDDLAIVIANLGEKTTQTQIPPAPPTEPQTEPPKAKTTLELTTSPHQKSEAEKLQAEAERLAEQTRQHGQGYLHGKFPRPLSRNGTPGTYETVGFFNQGQELTGNYYRFPIDPMRPPERFEKQQVWTSAPYASRIEMNNEFTLNAEDRKDWKKFAYYLPLPNNYDLSERPGNSVMLVVAVPPEIASSVEQAVAKNPNFPLAYFNALYPGYLGEDMSTQLKPLPTEEIVIRTFPGDHQQVLQLTNPEASNSKEQTQKEQLRARFDAADKLLPLIIPDIPEERLAIDTERARNALLLGLTVDEIRSAFNEDLPYAPAIDAFIETLSQHEEPTALERIIQDSLIQTLRRAPIFYYLSQEQTAGLYYNLSKFLRENTRVSPAPHDPERQNELRKTLEKNLHTFANSVRSNTPTIQLPDSLASEEDIQNVLDRIDAFTQLHPELEEPRYQHALLGFFTSYLFAKTITDATASR